MSLILPVVARTTQLQAGIRQRSLIGRCRLGRATELVFVLATGTVLVTGGPALAQTWDGEAGTDWATAENWDPDGAPDVGDTVLIAGAGGANQPVVTTDQTVAQTNVSDGTLTVTAILTSPVTVTDTGNLTVDSGGQIIGPVDFGGATGLNNGTLTGSLTVSGGGFSNAGVVTLATTLSGGTLSLGDGSDLADGAGLTVDGGTLNVTGLSGPETVGALSGAGGTIAIDAGQILVTDSAADHSFGGSITGAGAFTKTGAGTLTLTGANTVATTNITGADAAIAVTGSGTLTSTQITVAGATNTLSTDGGALNSGVVIEGDGDLILTGSESVGRFNSFAGDIQLDGAGTTLTLTGGGATQLTGDIAGDGGLTVNTVDQDVRLVGAKTYTGATAVQSGQLVIGHGGPGELASTSITVSGGSLTARNGALNAGTGLTLSGGTTEIADADTIATLSISGGATLEGAGVLTVTGAFTQSGGTVDGAGQVTAGTYAQSGGTMAGLVATTGGATLGGGTISGTLSGAAATVQGGTTTLTGTNSTNTTIATGGTLAVDGGAQTGDVTLAGGTLTGLSDSTVAGRLATTAAGGTVSATGGTTLTLAHANPNGGVLTFGAAGADGVVDVLTTSAASSGASVAIAAGTLRIGGAQAGAALMDFIAGTSVGAAGALDIGGFATEVRALTGSGTVTNSGAAAGLTLTGTSTFGGVIQNGTGTTALTVRGSLAQPSDTAVTLTGDNTFSGGTTVQGSGPHTATLTLQGAGSNLSSTGLVTVNTGGTLIIDGDETLGGLAGTGTGTVTIAAGNLTLAGAGDTSFAGAIGGAGTLVKNGTGTLTVTGSVASDSVTVNAGRLVLSGANSMTQITVAGATLRLESNGAAGGAGGQIRTTGSVIDYADGVTMATPIQIASNTTRLQVTTGSAEQSGVIGQDVAGRPLEKTGAGELVLSGANSFTGDMTVTGGTLTLTGGAALADSVDVILGSGATLGVAQTETIASLAGSAANAALTLNNNVTLQVGGAVDTTFAGTIAGNATTQLVNAGSGRLTLTGNASGLTGGIAAMGAGSEIAITGGGVTNANIVGAGTGATFRTDGGALQSGALLIADGQVTLTGPESVGRLTSGSTFSAAAGTVTLTGAGTVLTLTGAANALAPTAVNGIDGTINGTGTLAIGGGSFGVGATGNVQAATTIAAGATITNAGSMAAVGNAGSFTNTGTAGALTNSGAGGGSNSGTLASLTHGGTGSFANTGAVTGNTTVTGGTVDLDAGSDLSDSGTLAVSGGAVNVNTAETLGALDADGGTVTANATLTVGRLTGDAGGSVVTTATGDLIAGNGDNSTFAGVISGLGAFEKVGSGTLTLTGAQAFAGATTITAGQLALTGSGTLASTGITIAAGGSLRSDGGALAAGSVITNGGLPGAATAPFGLMLTGGGAETIAALGGAGTTNLSAGSVLTLTTGASAISGSISGAGGLTVAGTSATTLSGANTHTGPTTVNGAGAVLTLTGGAAIADTAAVTVTAGTLVVDTAEVIGALDTAAGGAVQLDADLTAGGIGGSATLAGSLGGAGAFIKAGTGTTTLTGSIAAGGTTVAAGTLAVGATGSIGNATTVDAGATLTNAGTVGAVTNAGTFTATGASTGALTNTGTASVTGGTTASIANAAGTTTLTGATVTGALTNTGGTVTTGGVTTAASVTNGATFNAAGTLAADVTNTATGTFATTAALSGAGSSFGNAGTLNVADGGLTGLSSLTNSGSVTVTGQTLGATSVLHNAGSFVLTNGTVAGAFTNQAVLSVAGISTVAGTLGGSGSVDLASSTGADRLILAGGAGSVGAQSFALNFAPDGSGDRIVSSGGNALSGDLMVFNLILAEDFTLGQQVIVVEGQTGLNQTFTVSTGLGGAVVYALADIDGNTVLRPETNPGIGGIASGVSLTQALIGNVVNRPTSPFVSGLAAEDGCSQGGFLRAVAGRSSATGTSDNGSSVRDNEISARFAGVQASYDFICNDGRFFNGWDGAAGILLGYNAGTTDQPIRLLTGSGSSRLVSVTETEFRHSYAGFYLVGSRDRVTADLQVRFENTAFTLNEQVDDTTGFRGLGLENADFDARSVNMTGRLSYRLDINDEGLSLVPTAGLSVTRTDGAQLNFAGGERLDLAAYTSTVGFVGGALARTTISPAGNAASTLFVSGNYYQEFGGDRLSRFVPVTGDAADIRSSSIGGYAEASVGLNYLRILEDGPGGARQVNANLRADARFGENVTDSYSLTAQVRLSF